MLLVFSHKITPRIVFIFKHICTNILGVEVSFTTVVEEFIAHQDLKMSYAKQPLGKELFVQCHDLLFDQGVINFDITVKDWEEVKCFFQVGEISSIPYDIFAAGFFLLSRYEEYLPHVSDSFGRYPVEESLAYRYHFLNKPVVDIWAYKFKLVVQKKYEDFEFPVKKIKFKPIIDISLGFKYAHKGLVRTIGGTLRDCFKFKFTEVYKRFLVLLRFRKDPYDTYKWIINKHKNRMIRPVFFFLLGDYSTNDKNINYTNKKFKTQIKAISDYFQVGLKLSFKSLKDLEILKTEKKRFENIFNITLNKTRNSYSKLNLPQTYQFLNDIEVTDDYSMGYPNKNGFRAGTSIPFYFYNLDQEILTPLKIHPYCFMDKLIINHSIEKREQVLRDLVEIITSVNGTLTMVVHNHTFSDEYQWNDWRIAYTELLDYMKNV